MIWALLVDANLSISHHSSRSQGIMIYLARAQRKEGDERGLGEICLELRAYKSQVKQAGADTASSRFVC